MLRNSSFTEEELDYLAEKIVDSLFTRIRDFVEQVEVALDEKYRQDESGKER